MKTVAVFAFLVCLLAAEVKGQQSFTGRCLCADKGVNAVSRQLIKKVEIFYPSPSCGKQEVIVTLINAKRKCLNPESNFTQHVIKMVLEKRGPVGNDSQHKSRTTSEP
ncbi:C-X-C motif chemokine 11-6-like [Misgurnus anguillicaudatus]|uniref:C-X-C motif chemokine 11-6-like n=1 Tax=Misgurnus anguillicaudatus TaxID=75329 RepID=UPI003CCF299F